MDDLAIRVDDLSKRYQIGERVPYKALRDVLAETIKMPHDRLSSLVRRHAEDGREAGPVRNPYIWALKDVSFEVHKGEVIGIIGRNGAGKSTLLKVLSRITKPTEGRAEIRGRVGSLLEVGTGFHPELTGRENIYLNGAILGMKRTEIARKFDEIVAFAELEKFIDTPVKRYSSGMYVRLAFAVAAHLEPEILFIDEVLAVGDVAFQKKCIGKMGDIAEQGRTVLFVSHNMNAVSQLCTRSLLFEQGRITSSGKPEDLISQYLNGLTKKTDSQTLADYRTGEVKAGFYQEVRINGELLPAEIVVDSQSCLCITLYGNTWAARHRDFRSGVHFHTQDGIRIFSVATPWSSLGHFDAEGRVRLDCRIDQLPLIPGRYLLSIGAGSAGQMLDWLESVCVLMVTPEPGVETDLLPDYKTHGYFRVGATWSFSRHPLVVHSTRRDISSGRLP